MIAGIDVVAIADAYMTPLYWWPYGGGLATMIVFGLLGFKAGHPWLWALGGILGALSLATIASGLANAVSIPYVDAVKTRNQIIAFAVVVAVFVILTALLALLSGTRAAREAEVPGPAMGGQK